MQFILILKKLWYDLNHTINLLKIKYLIDVLFYNIIIVKLFTSFKLILKFGMNLNKSCGCRLFLINAINVFCKITQKVCQCYVKLNIENVKRFKIKVKYLRKIIIERQIDEFTIQTYKVLRNARFAFSNSYNSWLLRSNFILFDRCV